MGSWPELPLLRHPQAPKDPHELILMNPIEKRYLQEGEALFGPMLGSAFVVDGERGARAPSEAERLPEPIRLPRAA